MPDATLTPAAFGRETLHGFVESWECDFNAHWAIRFYGRCFQMAAEKVAALAGRGNPGMAAISARHARYHRELRAGAAVELRSARIGSGEYAGAVAHALFGDGRLSASALDLPGMGAEALPELNPAALPLILPRDAGPMPASWHPDLPMAAIVQAGPIRPADLDHAGHPICEDLLRRAGYGVHHAMNRLGWTQDFIDRSGISRMGVQNLLVPLAPCPAGALVEVRSCIAVTGRRSFAMQHWVTTQEGAALAMVRDQLVAVDMRDRRATTLPDFLLALPAPLTESPQRC